MKLAYLFGGQGKAVPFIGRDFLENNPQYRHVFEACSQSLQVELCEESQTRRYAPAALVAFSLAVYRALREEIAVQPTALLGLSLGEYSALMAAHVWDIDAGMAIVDRRHQLMEEWANHNGRMLVVMQRDAHKITQLLAQLSQYPEVYVANINSPQQIVLGIEKVFLTKLRLWLVQQGFRCIKMNMHWASHTPLMEQTEAPLYHLIASYQAHPARVPVWSNTTKEPFDISQLALTLARQMVSTTHFMEDVQQLIADGVDTFIEINAQPVLAPFITAIDPSVYVKTVSDCASFHEVVTDLQQLSQGSEVSWKKSC